MSPVDKKLKNLIMESSYMNLTEEDIRDSSRFDCRFRV